MKYIKALIEDNLFSFNKIKKKLVKENNSIEIYKVNISIVYNIILILKIAQPIIIIISNESHLLSLLEACKKLWLLVKFQLDLIIFILFISFFINII